jgi:WD40 repeat protein
MGHSQEVCSLDVAQSGIVASAERGQYPSIIIWKLSTLTPWRVFKRQHNQHIHVLKFIGNDKYIMSASCRLDSGISVHDITTEKLLLSVYLPTFIRNGISTRSLIGEIIPSADSPSNALHFLLFSRYCLYFFKHGLFGKSYVLSEQRIDDSDNNNGESLAGIVCTLAFYINLDNSFIKCFSGRIYAHLEDRSLELLTGHEDGKIGLWRYSEDTEKFVFSRVLAQYNSPVVAILDTQIGFAICTEDMGIHIWDHDLRNCVKEIDINSMGLRQNSKLRNILSSGKTLFAITCKGETFKIELELRAEWRSNKYMYRYQIETMHSLFSLGEELRCLEVIERVE